MSAEREWDNLPCFSVPGAAGEKNGIKITV